MAKTRSEINIDYAKRNLKRIPLDVQKEHYEKIKAHAESCNETVNGFIKRAINEAMEKVCCRDCVYLWAGQDGPYCKKTGSPLVANDFFCAYGEQRNMTSCD